MNDGKTTFLDNAVKQIMQHHQGDMRHVALLLPAFRARVGAQEAFARQSTGVMWLPEMYLMPEFTALLSGFRPASPLANTLLLFEAYCESTGESQDFARFSSWASIVLKDFQEVEQYLVPANDLFTNLQSFEAVDNWSLRNDPLSDTQVKFLDFWTEISETYKRFSSLQDERGIYTYGALVRRIASGQLLKQDVLKDQTLWVVGMSAFTPAEEELFHQLGKQCEVRMLWDADAYYVKDRLNAAGKYLRNYSQRLSVDIPLTSDLAQLPREVEVIRTTTSTGEALALHQLLKDMPVAELQSTAIIIADSGLQSMVFEALPPLPVPIQSRLGWPLRQTRLHRWMMSFLHLKTQNKGLRFHHRSFMEWLESASDLGWTSKQTSSIRRHLSDQAAVYLTPDQATQLLLQESSIQDWMHWLKTDCTPAVFVDSALEAFERRLPMWRDSALLHSVGVHLVELMRDLQVLLKEHEVLRSFEVLKVLWSQLVSREELVFATAQGKGLEILSMVETRAVDFERIIVVGANDDVMPGNGQEQSYIPWDLRSYFKMPMPDDSDATYGYNFYRLLQRAKNIKILYSATNSDFKACEPSRFLIQLRSEWPTRNNALQWREMQYRLSDEGELRETDRMPNDAFAKARFLKLIREGLSPSAINKYNECPLQFYYRYIIGLGEEDVLEEEMTDATFGSIIHDVLERFYESFIGSAPLPEDLQSLIDRVKEELSISVKKVYKGSHIETGYNALALQMAEKALTRFLITEKQRWAEAQSSDSPITVLGVEQWLERTLQVPVGDELVPLRLKGKADYTEKCGDRTVIIDYKTGKVKEEDVLFNPNFKKSGKMIQLTAYIYMFTANGAEPSTVDAAFYSFTKHEQGRMLLRTAEDQPLQSLDLAAFEAYMKNWVLEILNCEAFEHNTNARFCPHCLGVKD